MSASEICPQPEQFKKFLSGGLSEEQLLVIESHLEKCDSCGDTIRSMNVSDTLIELVKDSKLPTIDSEDGNSSEIAPLLSRLEKLADSRTVIRGYSNDAGEDLQARVYEVQSMLSPPESDDELGRIAHYRVLSLLGAGGMGVVYQAEDTQLQRLVALKILRPSLGATARERFVQEARAAAAIDHDNVVTIYHVGNNGPLAFIAMQWLDGETLEDRLKRDGSLPPKDVSTIASQIADGLAAAHAKKLIHRDIKPANIWIEAERNRAKILDFGLARIADESPQLTETGMLAGTPAYMSPEQAQGRSVDERSDLFSLGTMMYRMLTGELPFDVTNALATIRSIQTDEPEPPRQDDLEIPATISDTVMDLLEKDPRNRPESASVVAASLKDGKRPPRPAGYTARRQTSQAQLSGARKGWSGGAVATMLLGMAALFAAPIIYRITTDSGEVIIESQDPNVQVELLQGGKVAKILDAKTNESVTIGSGEYDVRLKGNETELKLDRNKLTMIRNGKEIVRVTRIANDKVTPPTNSIADSPTKTVLPIPESKIKPGDAIQVSVSGTPPENPISGYFVVETNGKVPLGAGYGRVPVAGMTFEEAEVAINKHLMERGGSTATQVTAPFSVTPTTTNQQSANGQPVYDGQPIDHWLSIVKNEKSFEKVKEAVDAVAALVDRESSQRVCETFFDIQRDAPYGNSIQRYMSDAMWRADPEVVARVIEIELIDHSEDSTKVEFLANFLRHVDAHHSDKEKFEVFWRELPKHVHGHFQDDYPRTVRKNAETIFVLLCKNCGDALAGDNDSRVARLRKLFQEKPSDSDLAVAIAKTDPDARKTLSPWLKQHAFRITNTNIHEIRNHGIAINVFASPVEQVAPRILRLLGVRPTLNKEDHVRLLRVRNGVVSGPIDATILLDMLPRIGVASREAIPLLESIVQTVNSDRQNAPEIKASAKKALELIRNQYGDLPKIDVARLEDCESHVLGIYGPKEQTDDRVFVEVKATDKPIVLTLASYYSASWQIKLLEGAKVRQVIVSCRDIEDTLVEGLPDSVPIFKVEKPDEAFWSYAWNSGRGRKLMRRMHELTKLPISTYQGAYGGEKFVVDGKLGAVEDSIEDSKPETKLTVATPQPSELKDCKMHVIGVYGPPPRGDGRVVVDVKATDEPIVLTLAAYQSLLWKVNLDEGANVKHIIVGGYYEPQIEGVPEGVPVYFRSYFPENHADHFWGFAWHSSYARNMVKRLNKLTGLDVATFQGGEYVGAFVVDGKLGTREIGKPVGAETSNDVKPEERLSLKNLNMTGDKLRQALVGRVGIRDLDVSYNPLTEDDILQILTLKNLEILNLQHTGVTDKGLLQLKGLSNLKKVQMYFGPGHGTTADGWRKLRAAIPGLEMPFITHKETL